MNTPRIIGIMLVRNEDRFLKQAALNILEFCDRILIADHGSSDATPAICAELAGISPKFEVHRIREARESQAMLQPFAGTDTWIFGVDGDEVYDVAGLARLRRELLAGKFSEWWVVFGNVLNCDRIDLEHGTATGYLAPPCRSMTKLYNFRMVRELDPTAPQRLHSHHGRDVFHKPFHALLRFEWYKEVAWDDAYFRCLHACLMPRSSREPVSGLRENVSESLRWPRRLKALGNRLLGRSSGSSYKREKYMRGPLVTVNTTPFFP